MYKLDRSAFKAGSHESASDNRKFWEAQSMEERLKAACYLNSVAWNYPVDNPPKLDRTFFGSKREIDGYIGLPQRKMPPDGQRIKMILRTWIN